MKINIDIKWSLSACLATVVLFQCFGTSLSKFEIESIDEKRKPNNIYELKESLGVESHTISKRSVSSINDINRKQQRTNMVSTGLDLKPYSRGHLIKLVRYITQQGGLKRGYRIQRTVESPARSTDTGGRPSQKGLTGGITKFFSSKQGHYSDAYDDMDYHKIINSTQKSTEPNETLIRVDVQNIGGQTTLNHDSKLNTFHSTKFKANDIQ